MATAAKSTRRPRPSRVVVVVDPEADVDTARDPNATCSHVFGTATSDAASVTSSLPFPRGCMAWLHEHAAAANAAKKDGLGHAVEFHDPRPGSGGWIRVGHDADGSLRYSCNGELRAPFTQAILVIDAGEAYLSFPDIARGLLLQYSMYAATHIFPSLRAMFTAAGVVHNIPDDRELLAHMGEHPMSPCSLVASVAPDVALAPRGCRLIGCGAPTQSCCIM